MFLSKLGYSELVQRLFEKMTIFLVAPLPQENPMKRSPTRRMGAEVTRRWPI